MTTDRPTTTTTEIHTMSDINAAERLAFSLRAIVTTFEYESAGKEIPVSLREWLLVETLIQISQLHKRPDRFRAQAIQSINLWKHQSGLPS